MTNSDFINKLVERKENLNKQNEELNKNNETMNERYEFHERRNDLIVRLKGKIAKMSQRKSIIEMKYCHYKKLYDLFNIFIIIISSVLTIIEAIRNDIKLEEQDEATKQFLKYSPLIISTLIGLITSIIQFKKFQEKLDSIARTTEKSIFTIYRMKKLIEELYFIDDGDFDNIKQTYLDEIFTLYNQNQAELEKKLNIEQLIKYTNKINHLEIMGDKNNLDILAEQIKLTMEHNKLEKNIEKGRKCSVCKESPNVSFNIPSSKDRRDTLSDQDYAQLYDLSSYHTPEKQRELSSVIKDMLPAGIDTEDTNSVPSTSI